MVIAYTRYSLRDGKVQLPYYQIHSCSRPYQQKDVSFMQISPLSNLNCTPKNLLDGYHIILLNYTMNNFDRVNVHEEDKKLFTVIFCPYRLQSKPSISISTLLIACDVKLFSQSYFLLFYQNEHRWKNLFSFRTIYVYDISDQKVSKKRINVLFKSQNI